MSKLMFLSRLSRHVIKRSMCSSPSTGGKSSASEGSTAPVSPKYRPSELQKFILVWTKKYKNKAEIPTFVSTEIIDRSRSEARIKVANVLMILTVLASLGAIIGGKAAAKRGESVHQMNLDWHKKYDEEYKKKEAMGK